VSGDHTRRGGQRDARLRRSDALELLKRRGVPAVWRDSIAEHLAEIEELDARIIPIDRELAPIARSDPRAQLLGRSRESDR
jgi:transposase